MNLGVHPFTPGCSSPPGTGTVVVDVDDVNDVPPRFSRPEWTLDVSESLDPDNVLATLTVVDQDVTNDFAYRVSFTLPALIYNNFLSFIPYQSALPQSNLGKLFLLSHQKLFTYTALQSIHKVHLQTKYNFVQLAILM